MALKIGDSVFLQDGRPGLLVAENKGSDSVTVDPSKSRIKEAHRHGYINGLNMETRKEFDEILDEVKEIKGSKERIEELQGRIDTLSKDPKNMVLTRYLTAEMAHIMNMSGVRPKTFEVDAFKLR